MTTRNYVSAELVIWASCLGSMFGNDPYVND